MRTLLLRLSLLLAVVFSSGCASTLHMESGRDLRRFDGGIQPVYVTNPELQQEYGILRASAIYPLSSKPDGARLLTLHPIRQHGTCGNPLMLTMLTLGIVPGVLPAARGFEYDLQAEGVTHTYEHRLPLSERFSIWEWLLRRNEQKVLAEALKWSSPEAVAPGR